MPAPMNVRLKEPTESIPGWAIQGARWLALNQQAGGNPDFYPLTVKAAYVVGVIHDICSSVSVLLQVPPATVRATYIPAYGVYAAGVELLGRCVRGVNDTSNSHASLLTGFKWLCSSSYETVYRTHQLIQTSNGPYDIETLAQLRHFAAHGQASASPGSAIHGLPNVDTEILSQMPALIADGLERWWNDLQRGDRSETLCNRLAKANVIAFRNWPVFNAWTLFERDARGNYRSMTELFLEFDWKV